MKLRFVFGIFFVLLNAQSQGQALEIQGHRGARSRYPENTIPAFNYAIKVGVDVLELDLAVTMDNVLVVSHDPHLMPETCVDSAGAKLKAPLLIHSLTLAEVKTYDCGSLQNPKFPNQTPVPKTPIPTFQEVLDLVKGSVKQPKLNVETKIFPDHPEYTVDPETFVKLISDILGKTKMIDRVVLQSFDPRTLVVAKKIVPKLARSLLWDKIFFFSWEKILTETEATFASPNYKLVSKSLIETCHKRGIMVLPWTPNEENDWRALIDLGVDGIITDDPERLLKYVGR